MTVKIKAWCKHFNGMCQNTCKAGVVYDSVRDESIRPFRFPCFQDDGVVTQCAHCEYPTQEELAQEEREIYRVAAQFLTRLAQGNVCTVCGEPIERKEKIGRCVYGRPCGHLMYQGGLGE